MADVASDRRELLDGLVRLCLRAGREIMAIYAQGFEVSAKADASPVRAADTAAEAVILDGLARLAPEVPVVAEEEAAAGRVPAVDGRPFFLVDPLDGTREFVERRGDFTVNIALIEAGRPTLGVVHAPARGRLFAGDVEACAWTAQVAGDAEDVEPSARRRVRVRTAPADAICAVASLSHNTPETDAYLARYALAERVSVGSSLKFCLLAAGEADLYPRLGPTSEWDTAAGHAVLSAAGGEVFGPDGTPLRYGKPGFRNPSFVATGAMTAHRIDGAEGLCRMALPAERPA